MAAAFPRAARGPPVRLTRLGPLAPKGARTGVGHGPAVFDLPATTSCRSIPHVAAAAAGTGVFALARSWRKRSRTLRHASSRECMRQRGRRLRALSGRGSEPKLPTATTVGSDGVARVKTSETSMDPGSVDKGGDLRLIAIVVLCFFVTVICSLDRAAMSVAILPMSSELGYTDTEKGLVSSSYFWGYTVSNVFSGVLCTTVEPWLVLAGGVILWSAFTVLTPAAAYISLPMLVACRALMGVAEGVCLPTIQALLVIWVSDEDKSRAVALVLSGITAGTVGSLYLAPQLVSAFGWPSVFVTFGAAGFVWLAAWLPVAGTAPEELKSAACKPESCVIEASTLDVAKETWAAVPWGELFSSNAMRGVLACSVAHNTSLFLILSWLPTYFSSTFGLSIAAAAALAAPPWFANFLVTNAAGWLADALQAQGVSVRDVRRYFQLLGTWGPALALLRISAGIPSEWETLAWFTVALGFNGCSAVGFNAASQDMARKFSSVVYGLGNAAGCFGGSLGVFLTGAALDAHPEGGFELVFRVAACVYLVGGAAFFLTYRGDREFE